MECKNHPEVETTEHCSSCAEAFCDQCLVEVKGQKYCSDCKQELTSDSTPVTEEGPIPCKEAREALIFAIIGLFCFGIILGPLAIAKAQKAKKMIAENPKMTGSGKATAATILGIVEIVLWGLGIILRMQT